MMQPGGQRETAPLKRSPNKLPSMKCPQCGSKAIVRSSEEVHPTLRRLYFACMNLQCGMTFRASLVFESVISPSAIVGEMRSSPRDDGKPPGADFGQMTIFDVATRPKSATG